MAEMLFKKDGAAARLSNASIAVVREMFLPQNLNSRFSNLHCPARSPDLMVFVTSSCGVSCKYPSVNHLKVAVYEEVAAV